MKLILPKKSFFIFLIVLLFSIEGFSQTTGDYRSAETGDWNTAASWEYYNGSTWVTATTYPGQNTGTGAVLIQTGHTITAMNSVPNSIGIFTISGVLKLLENISHGLNTTSIVVTTSPVGVIVFDKKSDLRLLSNTVIQVGIGGLQGDCSNNNSLYVGSTEVAVCVGGGNSIPTFSEVMANGGYNVVNVTPSSATICASNSVSLTASVVPTTGATFRWYNAQTGGTLLYSGSVYSPSPSVTTTYYAEASYGSGGSAYSTSRKAVTVTVSSTTAAPTGTATQSFCSGATVSNLSATGSGIKWYSASTGGSALASTTVLTNGTHYYASQTLNSCESTTRLDVTAIISSASVAPTNISGTSTICLGSSTTLTVNGGTLGTGGTATWYSGSCGGTLVGSGNSVTVSPTATTTYYVRYEGGCNTTTCASMTVTVNPVLNAGAIATTGETICSNTVPSTTIGSTTAVSGGDGNYTYQWQYSPSSIFENNVTTVVSNTATYTPTQTLTQTTYYRRQVKDVTCDTYTSSSNVWTVIVNPVSFGGTVSASTAVCSGTNSTTLTLSGNTGNVVRWESSLDNFATAGITIVNTTSTLTVTNLNTTTTYRAVVQSGSCSTAISTIATINVTSVSTPTAGTPTNPTCTVPTGSVVLSNLPASGIVTRTGSYSNDSYVITGGGSQTITNLLPGVYYFAVTNGSCTSNTVTVTIVAPETNTWSTGSWSNGTPTINQRLVFASDYTNVNDVDIEGCSCQVTGTTAVTIKSGRTLKIENGVEVQPNATLTFENNASLVQMNDDVVNSGNIRYHRHTDYVKRYDFTYWSSPVAGQTLKALSPNTLYDKYYSYNPNTGWVISYNGTATMLKGNGYIIRAPQTFSITVPAIDTNPVFVGVPNNGVVTLPSLAGNRVHLLGNPYPSAIDADAFIAANSTSLEGTLYFWTHNTSPSKDIAGDAIYNYTTNDYVTYNKTGGVNLASGKIAAGQGFFAPATAAGGAVVFNNAMRYTEGQSNYDNSQFYKLSTTSKATSKITTTEKSRIWLNLTNKEGAFKQTLIGYISGATNDYDRGFDGMSYDGNQFVDFYSVNNNVNLTIQGRPLPFVKQDSVALGYKSTIIGEFQISIDHTDGVMSSQNVFLEDKDLNILHDLKKGAYTFSTAKGTFKNRFVLRYVDKNAVEPVVETPEVVTPEVDGTVAVSVQENQITVSSSEDLISKIIIYDISGKIIYQKENVSANDVVIQNLLSGQQVLLVSLVLENGKTTSTKIIY
ncbi:T9SS sorting signal type C domain-containing protein [Flavobacterium sp. GSA192]|uniref:Ig-like domain-containing protein n=1 Tax=Flavobacterium sp. GSA192 TaxID=2576304 RepID=UPI00112C7F5C|nr:T9SS sorting signal type C domain-containing protein [Flavobacterium sp. GSA192]